MSSCKDSNLGRQNKIGFAIIAQTGLLSITCVLVFIGLVLIIAQAGFEAECHHSTAAPIPKSYRNLPNLAFHCKYLPRSFRSNGLEVGSNRESCMRYIATCKYHEYPANIEFCIKGAVIQFGEVGVSLSTLSSSQRTREMEGGVLFTFRHRCWVYNSIPSRIFSYYLWLNITVFMSITLYVLLFFRVHGYIKVLPNGDKWYHYKITFIRHPNLEQMAEISTAHTEGSSSSAEIRSMATKMLWYPSAYLLSVIANVIRWKLMANIDPNTPLKDVPFAPIAATHVLYSMNSAVDVLLFYFTRPNIFLFGEPAPAHHRCAVTGPRQELELGEGGDFKDGTSMRPSLGSG
ncbi:hypothetical protein BOTBODRAFT_42926 [Botryobasidium botryosum FD-172 SS1]|uniref:Uncharacterized protein n=1 Tax=Botryobasidium botryosum (strain FD-172 SS1) TaxID=930990 RepID=A0A067MN87_BOTB1|nr:hypothetical protein BOTBODRAFT_42926 [Botryobasidium botryosum FD-172 SS1]